MAINNIHVLYLNLKRSKIPSSILSPKKRVGKEMGVQTKNSYKNTKPRSLPSLFIVPVVLAVFLFIAWLLFHGVFSQKNHYQIRSTIISWNGDATCSNIENNTICCDRTDRHSDMCFMKGDVRTHSSSFSILLFSSNPNPNPPSLEEKIRPYTRKWESVIMNKISELNLKIVDPKHSSSSFHNCDVGHNVTALFFSLGGYTGNIFHAFSNGLIPLYITSQYLNREVVFVVLEYRHWWYTKYQEILSQLSNYPLVDFSNDTRTHCFPNAIIGLRFHDTLAIDPSRMKNNKTIIDFHKMLDDAYKYHQLPHVLNKPKLVIVARNGTRVIENEDIVVQLVTEVGFEVEILRPTNTMPLFMIYNSLSSCDVMIGVHGAALTHFLFMRPKSMFIQIVPPGLEELAQLCFALPSEKHGIKYEEYRLFPNESSLYRKYGENDLIVTNPGKVKAKGWEVTKEVYLDGQNVTLEVSRLRERLVHAFQYAMLQRDSKI